MSDIKDVLSSIDILVIPSLREGIACGSIRGNGHEEADCGY